MRSGSVTKLNLWGCGRTRNHACFSRICSYLRNVEDGQNLLFIKDSTNIKAKYEMVRQMMREYLSRYPGAIVNVFIESTNKKHLEFVLTCKMMWDTYTEVSIEQAPVIPRKLAIITPNPPMVIDIPVVEGFDWEVTDSKLLKDKLKLVFESTETYKKLQYWSPKFFGSKVYCFSVINKSSSWGSKRAMRKIYDAAKKGEPVQHGVIKTLVGKRFTVFADIREGYHKFVVVSWTTS